MRGTQDKALGLVADEMVKEARAIVPVRTGYLKSTIGVLNRTSNSVTVGASASYAKFVENGTSKMQAQPYLHPALRDAMRRYPEFFERVWVAEGQA